MQIGLIYFRLPFNQKSLSDRSGVLFFLCTGQIMQSLNGVLLTCTRSVANNLDSL